MVRLSLILKSSSKSWNFLNGLFNAVVLNTTNKNKKAECVSSAEKKTTQNIGKTATPHPPRDPPTNYAPTEFKNKSFCPPEEFDLKIFRPLKEDEVLGPNAHMCSEYKNAEYFAYHRYSFADTLQEILKFRHCGPTKSVKCTGSDEADTKGKRNSKEKPKGGTDSACISAALTVAEGKTDDANYNFIFKPRESPDKTAGGNKSVNTPPRTSAAAGARGKESSQSSPGTESDKKSPGKGDTI